MTWRISDKRIRQAKNCLLIGQIKKKYTYFQTIIEYKPRYLKKNRVINKQHEETDNHYSLHICNNGNGNSCCFCRTAGHEQARQVRRYGTTYSWSMKTNLTRWTAYSKKRFIHRILWMNIIINHPRGILSLLPIISRQTVTFTKKRWKINKKELRS